MKNLLTFILYLPFICIGTGLMAQLPHIDSIHLSSSEIGLYEKLEIQLDIQASFSNPYDYKQVRVRGEFKSDSMNVIEVDGFFMETYEFSSTNGAIQRSNEDGFYLRFAPTKLGSWKLRVVVEDENGIDYSGWINFNVVNSVSPGFLRTNNSYYLNFDSGEPYIPVGHNIAWPNGSVFANYSAWLSSLKSKGGNYFRLWHCHWGLSLEWMGNGYLGLKNYKQSNAFYLDWLHDYCTDEGIYVMLCLQHHGQVSTQVNPNWSESPYNVVNGGMCTHTWEFFTDSMAKADTKNRLRYIVARWGYSPSIMSWELFNEVSWTDQFNQHASEIADWHEEMAGLIRELDPNKHLITTSLAENQLDGMFWTSSEMDISQSHHYLASSNIEKVVAQSSKSFLETFDKPTIVGEFGISTNGNGLKQLDPTGIHLHNGLWGGFFGGGIGTAGSWWWDSYIHPQNLYHHYEGFSKLVSQVPFLQDSYKPSSAFTKGNRGDLRIMPNSGWGVKGDDTLRIDQNGQITEGGKLGEYLYGSVWNTQFRSPPTFLVDLSSPGQLIVKTGTSSGQSPKIAIWLDGNKVLERNAQTDREYAINIPAGPHSIRVDNTGTDWITIASYTFTGIGSLLDSYVLKSSFSNALAAWIINPTYNHEEVTGGQLPDPISGSRLVVPGMENGNYYARWFNPLNGENIGIDSLEVTNDTLELDIPVLRWDLALILDQEAVSTGNELTFIAGFKAYPNPVQGEAIYIKADFPQEKGQAELIDMQGRKVQAWEFPPLNWAQKPQRLDLDPTLPKGYYWLKVRVGDRQGVKMMVRE